MRIVSQQTILMKYHALFVIFDKAANPLQIIDGALRVKKMQKDLGQFPIQSAQILTACG